jgi:hypothetical protein
MTAIATIDWNAKIKTCQSRQTKLSLTFMIRYFNSLKYWLVGLH